MATARPSTPLKRVTAKCPGATAAPAKTAATKRATNTKAWDKLTPAQKKATDRKKVAASRRGEQLVANTESARKARVPS